MKRAAIAAALWMLWLPSCSRPELAVATPDPAKLAACPADDPKLGALTPWVVVTLTADAVGTDDAGRVVTLPRGTELVLYQTAIDRERVTVTFIARLRDGLHRCRSVKVYVEEWSREMTRK